jgi:integrase
MKPKGRHPDKKLTAVRVRSLTVPGRYADGNGLYLVVDKSGSKRWILRLVVQGRRRDIGLGSVRLVSLADAREQAQQYRKTAREGGDPLAERRQARVTVPTFAEAARTVHAEHQSAWTNKKHAAQWITTLAEYVFPVLGNRRVDQIETPDVLRVLSPIWLAKPSTARRVKQRIGTVLNWAKAAGFRTGENPVEGVGKGLPKQPISQNHLAALKYDDLPAFVQNLRRFEANEIAKLAFEFLIMTVGRTSEILNARFTEVDFEEAIWTIPANRMKGRSEHRVPLPPRCMEILRLARKLSADSQFIFPGRSGDKLLSNEVFRSMSHRLGVRVTVHGFRSTFRD